MMFASLPVVEQQDRMHFKCLAYLRPPPAHASIGTLWGTASATCAQDRHSEVLLTCNTLLRCYSNPADPTVSYSVRGPACEVSICCQPRDNAGDVGSSVTFNDVRQLGSANCGSATAPCVSWPCACHPAQVYCFAVAWHVRSVQPPNAAIDGDDKFWALE